MKVTYTELGSIIEPAPLRRAANGEFPILSMTMHDGLVDQRAKFKKRIASLDTSTYRIVAKNQLVVGFPIDEGVLSFQDLYPEAIVSPAYGIWDIRSGVAVDPHYLERFLRSPHALAFYRSKLRGTTARRRTLPSDVFLSLAVPLPPMAEQRRIADILDRADALRTKRLEASRRLEGLDQALFESVLSSAATTDATIGDLLASGALLAHKDGNHGSQYPRRDDFGETGVPFISAKAISDVGDIDVTQVERLSERKAATLKIGWIAPGDVLLAHNASVGKVALYDGPWPTALIGTSLTQLRPDPNVLDACFLAGSLRSAGFRQQLEKNMAQTTRNQVPITAQRRLTRSICPLPVQREFANRLTMLHSPKKAHAASLARLDALLASLQYRAFRGEL